MDLLAHHYAYLSLPEAIRRVYDHRIWSSGRQGVKHRRIDTGAPSTQSFNLRFGVRVCIETLLNLLILFVVRTDRPLEILQPNSSIVSRPTATTRRLHSRQDKTDTHGCCQLDSDLGPTTTRLARFHPLGSRAPLGAGREALTKRSAGVLKML